ncbi:MAG: hypothetical protein KY475_04240 [Planctomycetes bacterium]|nr:hypothetical protein [Planctomycetota bacterium]
MLRAEDIQTRLKEKPFRPVRIIASEGLHYDILHPDLVLVGRRDLTIGYPGADNPSIYDQVVRVALAHVVAMEDIPASARAATENN